MTMTAAEQDMTELSVNRAEIDLIIRGLNSLDRKSLTADESGIRTTIAYKLGAATMAIIRDARTSADVLDSS